MVVGEDSSPAFQNPVGRVIFQGCDEFRPARIWFVRTGGKALARAAGVIVTVPRQRALDWVGMLDPGSLCCCG